MEQGKAIAIGGLQALLLAGIGSDYFNTNWWVATCITVSVVVACVAVLPKIVRAEARTFRRQVVTFWWFVVLACASPVLYSGLTSPCWPGLGR